MVIKQPLFRELRLVMPEDLAWAVLWSCMNMPVLGLFFFFSGLLISSFLFFSFFFFRPCNTPDCLGVAKTVG